MQGKAPFTPNGLIKEEDKPDQFCKLGLPCCQCACLNPDQEKLILMDHGCLCCLTKGQFPFGGDAPEPICAVYGLQCAQKDKVPVFGACTQPYTPGVCNPIMEKLGKNKTVEVKPGASEGGGAPPTEQIER
jgi:hypothetical protein